MNQKLFLPALDWVRLAASTDAARPVLNGVHVRGEGEDTILEATDGRVLCISPANRGSSAAAYLPGIWHYGKGANVDKIDGTYPNTDTVMSIAPEKPFATIAADNVELAMALCQAGIAGNKVLVRRRDVAPRFVLSVPVGEKALYFNPSLMLVVLKGFYGEDIQLYSEGMKGDYPSPVYAQLGSGRRAAVMPIRLPEGGAHPREGGYVKLDFSAAFNAQEASEGAA